MTQQSRKSKKKNTSNKSTIGTCKYSRSRRKEVWHNQALLHKNKKKMKSGSTDKKSEKIT